MKRFIYGLVALVIAATGVGLADSIITGSKPFTFIPGTVISSSQVNADFDYIINQVNTNAAKNGVNSSITALTGLTTPITPAQGGSQIYTSGTVGGTADALTISTTVPAVSGVSLSNRFIISFIAASTNTATGSTLNINSTGAITLGKVGSSGFISVRPGEIVSGNTYIAYYNGSVYILINMPRLFGTESIIASAATTDLGTSGSHFISITGTTTITSFGSTANVGEPIYVVKCISGFNITLSANILFAGISSGTVTCTGGSSFFIRYVGSGVWDIFNLWLLPTSPTVQRFTTGTAQTYTPTAGTRYIKVRMCGGGGGGGAAATNNGANGTASSFGSWTADFGDGGERGGTATITNNGGVGGSGGTNGTGTLINRVSGGKGYPGGEGPSSAIGYSGGGGVSPLGGAGAQTAVGAGGNNAGDPAKANSCSGGGGGANGASNNFSAGGGAGEYVEFYVSSPGNHTYTVGAKGAGGAAGTAAGGDGGDGIIIVEEFQQ